MAVAIESETISSLDYGLDKNAASRGFELLPKLFGPRGQFFVDGYKYLAWVDDQVDENRVLSIQGKKEFLGRQIDLVRGKTLIDLNEFELLFANLSWNKVPEKEVRSQVEIILFGIKDDLDCMPLKGRSKAEIRHAEWRTALPTLRIASLVLNGHDLHMTSNFAKLVETWSAKDDINHFSQDISDDLLKLPLDITESQLLNSTVANEREKLIYELFPREKLTKLQWQNVSQMARYLPSVFDTNLKISQKLIFFGYMFYRITGNTIKNLNKSRQF